MTEHEIELIGQAASDLATGNDLIRPRTKEQRGMIVEVCHTLNTQKADRTERQNEIYEQYRLHTDYKYWLSKHSNLK